MRCSTIVLLAMLFAGVAEGQTGVYDRDRKQATKGRQHGIDVGIRAVHNIGRGGAARPGKNAKVMDVLETLEQGMNSGFYRAPHYVWETVVDPKTDIDPVFTNVGVDIGVSILALLATISAAGAGIGGGGLLVPIYLLILNWHVSLAVPLSNATIFGNAIANIMINFPLRHPTADRPLVDFDLALILIPMELTGSLVGVLLNIIFPQWLTLTCLLALLIFTTWRTYGKGKASWDKENHERTKANRLEKAQQASPGDSKSVKVENEEGEVHSMKVIYKDDESKSVREVMEVFQIKQGNHIRFRDPYGDVLKYLTFETVDDDCTYYIKVTEGMPNKDLVDWGFRKSFTTPDKVGPTKDDHNKLIVLEVGTATRPMSGEEIPFAHWKNTEVLSWVQRITDDSDAFCWEVNENMISGADLSLMSQDSQIAHSELERLGVLSEEDRKLVLEHLDILSSQDYMLLVHSSAELPWGSWNRSAEWEDILEQKDGRDLDGWLEDDPLHPKNETSTYVGSQSYCNIDLWTAEDVNKWISKISDYNHKLKEAVIANDITGTTLRKLTVEDSKQLAIPQLGPRLALLERIRELEKLNEEHEEIVDSERHIPFSTNLLILFASWLMLLVLAVLRGGGKKGGQSPVAQWQGVSQADFCNSTMFWVLWFIGVPVLLIVTYLSGNYLLNKHKQKVKTHFAFHDGDIKWTKGRVRIYPLIVVAAGVLAGLLGVGGAMVTGPLMLEMAMIPRVSTATSSFLIIFTTGVAAIAYISLGQLSIDWAMWFATIGFVGAFIGLKIVQFLIKKYNRQSMVIWSLTLVFILAAFATAAAGIYRFYSDYDEGKHLGFSGICD